MEELKSDMQAEISSVMERYEETKKHEIERIKAKYTQSD